MSEQNNSHNIDRQHVASTAKAAAAIIGGITVLNGVFEVAGEHTAWYKYPTGIASSLGFYTLAKFVDDK